MLTFQLDFDIDEGHINTFLIGSKSLFEKIEAITRLMANSIDVEISFKYKLIELESSNISYQFTVEIIYPVQCVFGYNINRDQIDEWFREGLCLLFDKRVKEEEHKSLSDLANKTGLDLYFIYVEIPKKTLQNLLDDFEKLSILLFNKLVFWEQKR